MRSYLWKLRQTLREDKFTHNLQKFLNPICSFGDVMETTFYYLFHCPNYLDEMKGGHSWTTFKVLEKTFMIKGILKISAFPLFGISSKNDASNIYILNATIHIYWLLKDLTTFLRTFLSRLNNSHFSTYILTLPTPRIVYTRFNDTRLFLSFFLIMVIISLF